MANIDQGRRYLHAPALTSSTNAGNERIAAASCTYEVKSLESTVRTVESKYLFMSIDPRDGHHVTDELPRANPSSAIVDEITAR
jgi:hypothetical protein